MKNNIIFILAEGDHDSAFIYRILKVNGFCSYEKKIKDYPEPLNNFLKSNIKEVSIPESNIQETRTRFLPYRVMKKGNNLVLIYSIRGDSERDTRTNLIKKLNDFNTTEELEIQVSPNTSIVVLYFFDADNKGTKYRIDQIIKELKDVFKKFEFKDSENYKPLKLYEIENIKIGAYIFRKEEDKGMLEDIMLPLMRHGNDDIFEAAETFLKTNKTCSLFSDKLKYDESGKVLKKVDGKKYNYKKSLIGTVGQLQMSGKSNTVCIQDSSYLNCDKIKNNDTCKEIVEFLKKALI